MALRIVQDWRVRRTPSPIEMMQRPRECVILGRMHRGEPKR